MSTVQKFLIKAGATIAFASMFTFGNTSDASAQEMSADNWEPRTVSEISSEIAAQKENQDGNDAIEYTFQWGDTLWGVSKATDVSIDKLAKVNDIDNRSMIQVDTKIYLSGDSSIISVENNDEVVSYDVSEEEVVETETPQEVQESVKEEVVEEEAVTEETPEATETTAPEAPSEDISTSSSEAQASAQSGRTVSVEATAYSLNQPELGNITYSGIDLRQNPNVIAVDPSFIPLGSRINVPGYGEFIAGDTGGAIKGNRIDIHMTDIQQALQFGRRSIEVQIIE
ncbi:3D domain-containing protein [Marinilactibacillus sp. Marseille-P9653]|uniref:3D domain-containing protein n=1 Tax=Marinilactibacillus sp. Marseille-P9653 TaxID=2866583 RepID=UPI001CE3BDF9|nr:3D domain-containing protein [Marinilactibacillus sp. Marseille-P9653]